MVLGNDVMRLDKSQLVNNEHDLSSHAIGVNDALKIGHALNLLPDNIILFGLFVDIQENILPGTEQVQSLAHAVIKELPGQLS